MVAWQTDRGALFYRDVGTSEHGDVRLIVRLSVRLRRVHKATQP